MIRDALDSAVRSPLLYLGSTLLAAIVAFSALNEFFGTLTNARTIGAGAAGLGIVAIGVTVALAAGAIDFSVAGTMALCGMVGAWLSGRTSGVVAIALVLALALAIGALNGVLVSSFDVNPFLATLAMAGALRGLAFVIGGSSAGVEVESAALLWLGDGMVLGVPAALIILLLTAATAAAVLRATPFGRNLLAVGGNAEAARLSGVPVARLRVAGYMISAVAAGLGGLVLAARSGAGLPQAASGQELLIFSAVILGGTSLWGGRASVVGSLLGIALINVLYSGLTLEQVSSYWQTILQGVLLIAAVWLVQRRRASNDALASVAGRRGASPA